MSQWTDKSQQLLDSIASDDMVDRGCYLVNFHDVEAYEPRLRGGYAAAWTSPIMDLILADWLTKQRRWTGRGFATILHADLLPRWMDYAGAVLHEFGHYLTMPVAKDCNKDESIVNDSLELVGWLPLQWSEKNHRPVQTVARKPLPIWHDHGPDFVRACCHLVRRAQHSVYIRPEHLRFVSPYHGGRVHEDDFMDALESELDATGSVREILKTTAPNEFTKLWNAATATNTLTGEEDHE